MKNYLYFFIFIIISLCTASAQHENDNWFFKNYNGITFKYGNPISVNGGQIRMAPCAVMSDKKTGDLLFYTDGKNIWNRNHQIMQNGANLMAVGYSPEYALILPDLKNELQFIVFTLQKNASQNQEFCFSIISMQDPDGEVISKDNVHLITTGKIGSVVATRDCEGNGFWIVTHSIINHLFYSYHITTSGINILPSISTPILSTYIPTSIIPLTNPEPSYMKISPNGRYLAIGSRLSFTSDFGMDLFDFNAATGEVTNRRNVIDKDVNDKFTYQTNHHLSFSPDNTKLYGFSSHRGSLVQFDISSGNEQTIRSSLITIDSNFKGNILQLGPNGRIYTAQLTSKFLSAIQKPNLKGKLCSFSEFQFYLGYEFLLSFPNMMEYNFGRSSDTSVVCSGSSGVRIGPSPFMGFSYSWSPVVGLDNSFVAQPIASPNQLTEYKLRVISDIGCESFQTYIVIPGVKAKITSVAPICVGNSVQLSASGGDSYQWSPAESLDTATKSNPIATPKVSTRYKVVTVRGDCKDSAYVNVDVIAPKANAGKDKIICSGGRIQIGDAVVTSGVSYTWTPTNGLNNTIIPNPIASPTKTTTYILEVYQSGCLAYDTVVVTVVPKTKAVVSADTTICGGGSVQLSASGGISYSWMPSIGLDNPTIPQPIASPKVTTKYTVIVSNGDCIDSAFVTIKVVPFSGAKAGIDKTVCPNSSTQLGAPPEAGNTYFWSDNVPVNERSFSNPTVKPDSTTEYILKVVSGAGCVAWDTVLVTVGTITAKVSPDTALCFGSSVELMASGGSEYSWSPSIGLNDTTLSNPIATPTLTTVYKVLVSSGTCKDSAFVTVTVNPLPTANAGADQTICAGEPVQIGENPIAGNTYFWTPQNGLNNPSLSNPIASPNSTTEYILKVVSGAGCVAWDTVLVTVGNLKAKISGDVEICEGEKTQLLASGGNKYSWSPSVGLNDTTIPNPIASPTVTTIYKVLVSNGNCLDSAFVKITINPKPIADAGADQTPCKGEIIELGVKPQDQDNNTYSWQPTTGLSNPLISNPIVTPNTTTEYIVTVVSGAGCVARDTVLVTVNPANERSFTLIPSVISIIPGQMFETSLKVPSGVTSWNVRLIYDSLVVVFNSIVNLSNGLTAISQEQNGQLYLQGTGEKGEILLRFTTFLPYNSDTTFPISLVVDTAKTQPCETVAGRGNLLELSEYCGKRIRMVSSTGKNYFLSTTQNSINFGVGLTGNVRMELYDYTGSLKEVLVNGSMPSGEYSLEFDLPVGVYFCRMRAGGFEKVERVNCLNR